jgi:hypothetical protein
MTSLDRSASTEPFKGLFDKLIIAFLFVHLVFFLLNWYNYPTELDTPYHLLMGKMFADHGRIMFWDSYQFAPIGRPNLYPPLEHILVWFMHSLTGLMYMDIGRVIVIIQLIAGLILIALFTRKLFGSRVAFFALLFFASSTECWWWQTAVAPAALIVIFFWPTIYFYYKKSILIPTVFLTASLYLNYGLSFTLILTMFLAMLFSREYRKTYFLNFLIIISASVLLFSPWIYHISLYKEYFLGSISPKKIKALELFSTEIFFPEIFLNLNIFLWLFSLSGLISAVRKIKVDFKYALIVAGFWSYFIFLFLFNGTRFNAHFPIVLCVLAALGCARFADNLKSFTSERLQEIFRKFLVAVVFFTVFFEVHILTPRLIQLNSKNIDFMGLESSDVFFRKTPLLNEIVSVFAGMPLEGKHAVRIQRFFTYPSTVKLLKYIYNNIDKNEVLHIENGAVAALITLTTERKTDWGMYWEVVTPEMMRQITANKHFGYYVSPVENFTNLLPKDYLDKKIYPILIEKAGVYNIGYLPNPGQKKAGF